MELTLQNAGALSFETVDLAGVETAILSRRETTDLFISAVRLRRAGESRRPLLSSSMNGQTIYESLRSPALQALFNRFDLNSIDGQPAVLVSRFWPTRFPERVATTDLVHDVVQAGLDEGVRHYLLGATADIVARAKAQLEADHPGVVICGAHHGYIKDDDVESIAAEIGASGCEVLWVCMGVPKEQNITLRISELLAGQVAVIKTGGGVLDFVSGARPRAPQLLQAIGMEWIFRLYLEPRRLFMRYLHSNPVALFSLISTKPIYRRKVAALGD